MGHFFLAVLLSYTPGKISNTILIPRLSLQQVHQLCGSKPINTEIQKHLPKALWMEWKHEVLHCKIRHCHWPTLMLLGFFFLNQLASLQRIGKHFFGCDFPISRSFFHFLKNFNSIYLREMLFWSGIRWMTFILPKKFALQSTRSCSHSKSLQE